MPSRLLVIDDSPEVATLLRWIARRSGRELTIAASAEDALALVGPSPVHDLILVDINLPGMDGIELSRLLMKRGGSWPLAVFIQSGLADDLSRAIRVGIEYAFYKDHLAHPDRWNARCDEILTSLAEPATVRVGSGTVGEKLKLSAVRSALESSLGTHRAGLASALMERSWIRMSSASASAAAPVALGSVPPEMPAAQVAQMVDALDDLLWRLLGREESRAVREALHPFTLLASGGGTNE